MNRGRDKEATDLLDIVQLTLDRTTGPAARTVHGGRLDVEHQGPMTSRTVATPHDTHTGADGVTTVAVPDDDYAQRSLAMRTADNTIFNAATGSLPSLGTPPTPLRGPRRGHRRVPE